MKRRDWIVYGMLSAVWALLIGWQMAEHSHVKAAARETLVNRAKDISDTLGMLMRSQRFFGIISPERLESALKELVKHGDLSSVVLLNAVDEIIASAGESIEPLPKGAFKGGVRWGRNSVTLVNLVDLGTNLTHEVQLTNLSLVMPAREIFRPFGTNHNRKGGTNNFRGPRREENELHPPHDADDPERRPPPDENGQHSPDDHAAGQTNAISPPPRGRPSAWWRPGPGNNDSYFVRPFWMSEEEFKKTIQKKGVHSFIIVMSTKSLQPIFAEDLLLRFIIGILGTISVVGIGLSWRNLARNAQLQIRLVRASEQNLHLQQMNLAAAGLAHETRNPLNIVRGLAQLISKGQGVSADVHEKSVQIIDETDRVTAQLNEFINFSRPREVHYSTVKFFAVATEVSRALGYDLEEKKIQIEVQGEQLVILADEAMLRQALFNLVLNAIQSVDVGGKIQIIGKKMAGYEASIEVCDNGHGVASEHVCEIFKPYFTTREKGTGLGLAVVQQIVAAHHWEIHYIPNTPTGAIFCISQVQIPGAHAPGKTAVFSLF